MLDIIIKTFAAIGIGTCIIIFISSFSHMIYDYDMHKTNTVNLLIISNEDK